MAALDARTAAERLVGGMIREELRAILDEELDPSTDLDENEQWLLRHFAAVAAILPDHAELYRALLARREAEGISSRAVALEAAATIAALMQSLSRRRMLVVAAWETPLDPTHALGALDQLFHSLTLLTSPTKDEQSEAMFSVEELDELMTLSDVPAWLTQMGATER